MPLADQLHAIETDLQLSADTVSKSAATFGVALRAVARGAWLGIYNYLEFSDGMWAVLIRFYTKAWYSGAKECGKTPDQLTPAEINALHAVIYTDGSHIGGLYTFIEENQKAKGGKWHDVASRLLLWENAYAGIQAQARTMACGDQMLEWHLSSAPKEHCKDCLRLNGKVYRASVWYSNGVVPRSRALECRGYRCGCELLPTSKPGTPGRPPRIGA